MSVPRISLDQWATFRAVVEAGSFAKAAERLHKSQSSVSYAISRLNELLPTPVLTISGRRAVLTPEGEVLYRRAVQLLEQAGAAEEIARQLAQGVEAEVTLAVDGLMEPGLLLPALTQFSSRYPLTRLRVLETQLSGTEEALLEKTASIAIGPDVPVGFMGIPLRSVRMVAVARPDHPLFDAASADSINDYELRTWRQVVIRDSGKHRQQDAGWLGSEQRWTVSHFSTCLKILYDGLAFAFMPHDWIASDLEAGRLKPLPLSLGAQREMTIYLMTQAADSLGPATRELIELLRTHFRPEE